MNRIVLPVLVEVDDDILHEHAHDLDEHVCHAGRFAARDKPLPDVPALEKSYRLASMELGQGF